MSDVQLKIKTKTNYFQGLNSFEDLYVKIQKIRTPAQFRGFLKTACRQGKLEIQEAIFRLFFNCNIILPEFTTVGKGRYNYCEPLLPLTTREFMNLPLGRDGQSDHTAVRYNKDGTRTLLSCSSKNHSEDSSQGTGSLGISDLLEPFNREEGGYKHEYKQIQCSFVVRDKRSILKSHGRNPEYERIYKEAYDGGFVFDYEDLVSLYSSFKRAFGNTSVKDLVNIERKVLVERPHQILLANRLRNLLYNKNRNKVILDCVCRSGKTMIMGSLISLVRPKTVVLMSCYPEETRYSHRQLIEDHIQFEDYEVIDLSISKDPPTTDRFVVIASIHGLRPNKNSTKMIKWLKDASVELCFIDECQRATKTTLAESMFERYFKKSKKIFVSGTTKTTENHFKISEKDCVRWKKKDIELSKRYPNSLEELDQRHENMATEYFKQFSKFSIREEYKKVPELKLFITDICQEYKKKKIQEARGTFFGWSPQACLLLKQAPVNVNGKNVIRKVKEFQDKQACLELLHRLVGDKTDRTKPSYLSNITDVCNTEEPFSRVPFSSSSNPTVMMIFLPFKNIGLVSDALEELWKDNLDTLPDFEIVKCNTSMASSSKTDGTPYKKINPIKKVEIAIANAKKSKKTGVVCLTGVQCSAACTIPECDIVVFMNGTKCNEFLEQALHRCMNEAKGKTKGFVVNMNLPDEFVDYVIDEARSNFPQSGTRTEAVLLLQKSRILTIDPHRFITKNDLYLENLVSELDKNYESRTDVYKEISKRIPITISDFLREMFYKEFGRRKKNPTKSSSKKEEKMKKGIESEIVSKEEVEHNERRESVEGEDEHIDCDSDEEDIFSPKDTIDCIYPFLAFLTSENHLFGIKDMIGGMSREDMFVLREQVNSWWGVDVCFKKFMEIIVKIWEEIERDPMKEVYMKAFRDVKEEFLKNIGDKKKFSNIIDKMLKPQIRERYENAEISTPTDLRREMLDKIPKEFWKTPKKVLEPCSGKGGFLVDIYDRFYEGLSECIPDEEERERVILEECIYFGDKTIVNTFVSKKILDRHRKYKLNFYQGNYIEADLLTMWNLEGFDAVIGNPPYERTNSTGDNKFYLEFIKKSLTEIKRGGYLLFITPINVKNYITNQEKNRSYFSEFYKIKYLSINTANHHFSTIGMFFSYFLIEKTPVESCISDVEYLRGKNIDSLERSTIKIREGDFIPLRLSKGDYKLIGKVSNLLGKEENHEVFDIKKAVYERNGKRSFQRIRAEHYKKGQVSKKLTDEFKYSIIDKITKTKPFPGVVVYNKEEMIDRGSPKVVMCTGGYLSPSYDFDGRYNLSDNMIYILVDTKEEFLGMKVLIESKLVAYLNTISMTDGLHGRDVVIMSVKKVDLCKLKSDEDVYREYGLDEEDIKIIDMTV